MSDPRPPVIENHVLLSLLVRRCDALDQCADLLDVGAAVVLADGNPDRACRMREASETARRLSATASRIIEEARPDEAPA